MHDRAGAHHAGLKRHVQIAIGKTVIAQRFSGIAQGHDFGMCSRVAAGDGLVVAAADDDAVFHHHRTHRHFAGSGRLRRQLQCLLHVSDIAHAQLPGA